MLSTLALLNFQEDVQEIVYLTLDTSNLSNIVPSINVTGNFGNSKHDTF